MRLTLHNPAWRGRGYVVLAGLSGRAPGIPLPPPFAYRRVDLRADGLTQAVLAHANSPALRGFAGRLDGNGRADAILTLPPLPALAGARIELAYVQGTAVLDFASETVSLTLTP